MKVKLRIGKNSEYLAAKVTTLKEKYSDLEIEMDNNTNIDLSDVEIFVTTSFNQSDLETANKLKYIIIPFTGVNTLPLKELNERNIKVVNSHVNGKYVAEKAFTLCLSMLGRIVELDSHFRSGKWSGYDQSSQWNSLHHMTCGILGLGAIGQHIVNYLQPFDCKVHTLERYRNKGLTGDIHYFNDVEALALNSDILFVSLPLTSETKNLINEDLLSRMHGKYIINVGRGDVINEEALYHALKNNVLKGAALDVWYNYPKDGVGYPSKYPFHELKNVVISPHCAGNAANCRNEEYDSVVVKLEEYLKGKEFKNVVDVTKEY